MVGHREQVEGAQPLQPVAVLGEDRDVAGQRGRVAGDVRDGARRAGRRPARRRRAWRPRAAGRGRRGRTARRTTAASTRSTRPGRIDRARRYAARLAAACSHGRAGRPRPRRRGPVDPTASARNRGEQPDAGVQVEHRLPRLRAPGSRARSRPATSRRTGVHLPEAVGGDRERRGRARSVTTPGRRASRVRSGSRRRAPRRASGACASRAARRAARRSAAGCASAARPTSPGTGLDDRRRRRARPGADSCSRPPPP